MGIKNRDRFPDVDWLEPDEIKQIGEIGGTPLVLIGWEQGWGAPIVSCAYTADPASEELFAVPLYELQGHSQDPISITGSLQRAS